LDQAFNLKLGLFVILSPRQVQPHLELKIWPRFCPVRISANHRYLRKLDFSKDISMQKNHFDKRAGNRHIDKTKPGGKVNEQPIKTRQGGWINVPA
jgi:hypothetical protein